METPSAGPAEEAQPRHTPTRPTAHNGKNSQGLIEAGVQRPSESPDSGGVVASSQTESGSTRGAMEDRQTRDQSALADTIRQLSADSSASFTDLSFDSICRPTSASSGSRALLRRSIPLYKS